VEATICKTVFAGDFSSLFMVAFTLLIAGYVHLHVELLMCSRGYASEGAK
jgi:hypothetical protein